MRSQRLLAIKKIIQTEKIGNQEELLQRLTDQGFDLTQATVSRDLKALQAGKKADPEKGSILYLPGQSGSLQDYPSIDQSLLTSAFQSVQFANQFGVIKTIPGYANSVAVAIDKAGRHEIVGTIAGDDTILLIPQEGMDKNAVKKALQIIFPGLDDVIFSPGY